MIAKVREYDYEEIKQEIQRLIDLSYTSDTMGIVASMKRSFQSLLVRILSLRYWIKPLFNLFSKT